MHTTHGTPEIQLDCTVRVRAVDGRHQRRRDPLHYSHNVDPPQNTPEEVSSVRRASSDGRVREIIHFAQQLLREQPPLADVVETRAGEELVRIAPHPAWRESLDETSRR